MDFALGAILLIILLLPGAAVQHSYYSSVQIQSDISIPFTELLLRGIMFSLLIHTIGLLLINLFYNVDITALYNAIEGQDLHVSNKGLNDLVVGFGVYNLAIVSGSWLATKLFKRLVRNYYLDVNLAFLRSTNYWYNIFSARYLEINDIDGRQSNTDLIFLDVRVKGNLIYSGILVDFNFSATKDELENIVLTSTVKRIYDHEENKIHHNHDDTRNNSNFLEIPGTSFIIPNSEIFNINVHYLNVHPTPEK